MPKGLDYVINIKDGDFGGAGKAKAEVQGIDQAVERTHEKIGGLGASLKEAAIMVAEVFAAEKVYEFGKESVAAFRASESAAAQAQQGIISTNGIAGKTIDELREKAEALEKTTLFGDEQTLAAEAIQLSFTNIRGAIYDQAIPAIQDMATRMAGGGPADLKGAALLVDKALQDPIRGIGQLHRVGVDFSAAQEKMIETDIKHGQIQKAQAIILKELNTEFGGSAVAARKVLGASADLDQQNEELKKSFGSLINDGLQVVTPMLVEFVHGLQEAVVWVKQNKDILEIVAVVAGGAAAAYLGYEGVLLAIEAPMAIMTAGQWLLNAAMDANPVGIIVVGIGALIGGLVEAYKHSEKFRAVLDGIGEVAKDVWKILKGLGEAILGLYLFNPKMIKEGISEAVDGVKDIGGAFNRGYDNSLAASKKEDAEKEKQAKASELVTKHGQAKNQPYSIGKSGKGKGDDESSTLSGGRSVRNVKVDINKLVEKLEIHTTNIQGANATDIKRQLTELLVGVVHDSELALGSQ